MIRRILLSIIGVLALVIQARPAEARSMMTDCALSAFTNQFGRAVIVACEPGFHGALTEVANSGIYIGPLFPIFRTRAAAWSWPLEAQGSYQGRSFPPPAKVTCTLTSKGTGRFDTTVICVGD